MRISAVRLLIAATCLASTSCNREAERAAGAAASNQSGSTAYPDRLRAMSVNARNAQFAFAARHAGQACDIQEAAPPEAGKTIPIWTVTCTDGGSLAMVLSQEGVDSVLRTRARTPAPAADNCSRLLGQWSNGRSSATATQEGPNVLIVYGYSTGAQFRFVGPCENGRVITHTDWVGDFSYLPSSDTVIFERQTLFRH